MPHIRHKYNANQKLKSKKLLEQVFAKGNTFLVFPVKVFFLLHANTGNTNLQAGVGTGKRNFKKATQRNRIKRVLREAFRLHKHALEQHLQQNNISMAVFLLFIDKEMPSSKVIDEKMKLIMQKLINATL